MPRAFAATVAAALAMTVLSPRAGASDTWTTPHPGMRLLARTTSTPWRLWATEIDLCERGVKVRATDESEHWHTVPWFASHVGAEAAVNGDFFSWATALPSGMAVGNNDHWHNDTTGAGFVSFGRHRAWGTNPSLLAVPPPEWIRNAVGGHPGIVNDGAIVANNNGLCTERHPRTAVGLSEDRQTLYLVVVDGRSGVSVGMTCAELGNVMLELGAHWALNLDGGGSSTLWVRTLGVVNTPSDGTPRTVSNHLAVLASGVGAPGSCDWSFDEVVLQAGGVLDDTGTTDIDGDGRADACARANAGLRCRPSTIGDGADAFGPNWTIADLSNSMGWGDESNFATLRMGDVTGDGLADVCGRSDDGVLCWASTGTGFDAPFPGPVLSDDMGWDHPSRYSTLRLADIDGDGADDLCARTANGFRCWPATGDGFGDPVMGPSLNDSGGWYKPYRYGTIRMGDLDGDGRADLCARRAAGMRCWLSVGTGFSDEIDGPPWSNDDGWDAIDRWSTIRLVDVDGDGRADLCGRSGTDYRCHLSDGAGFGEAVIGPELADTNGWSDHANYSTIRFGDVDGDGDRDLCARANARFYCWLWDGTGFPERIDGPELSDALGWNDFRYYSTVRLADVDGDRRADVCARGVAGLRCWLSDGMGFPTEIEGPHWSDGNGWDRLSHFSTLRVGGPTCSPERCDNGLDDDCDGVIDNGCSVNEAGTDAGVAPGPPGSDAGPMESLTLTGACGCQLVGGGSGKDSVPVGSLAPGAWLLLTLVWRRRRAHRSPAAATSW